MLLSVKRNSLNKRRIGTAALIRGRRLLSFLSQMRRLFGGGAYSSKYGINFCDFYIIDLIPFNYVLLHFLCLNIIAWSSLSRWSLALYSDWILKGLESVRSCFVDKYTLVASQWTRNFQYCSRRSIENFLFIILPARACICQQNTHNSP